MEFEQKSNGAKAKIEFEQADSEDRELKGLAALNYLLPILESLDLSASQSRNEVIDKLLVAFDWDGDFEELALKVNFPDGTKIDLNSKDEQEKDKDQEKDQDKGQEKDQEKEQKPKPAPVTIPFVKFELEIESSIKELSVEFEQKRDGIEAEVEIEQKGKKDIELKGSAARTYLLPILEKLDLNASLSRSQVVERLLKAFSWEGDFEELEIKIKFADGSKIDMESKGVRKPLPVTLRYIKFELEIESADKELSVEFEQKRDGIEAEVEIEQKGQRDIELEGNAALNYLLPILEKLDLTASMSRKQIISKVLAAFSWEGDYEDFEIEIKFADGSKIDFD